MSVSGTGGIGVIVVVPSAARTGDADPAAPVVDPAAPEADPAAPEATTGAAAPPAPAALPLPRTGAEVVALVLVAALLLALGALLVRAGRASTSGSTP